MSKPNLILIVSDQHRGDWLGSAGNPFVHTPNLDRMARDGVQFTRAYCNSPLCVPSRMSMLTGKIPHHTDVFTNGDMLRSDIPTLAHAMGLAGYDTILCGRMHFVGPDQRHGYQERLVGDITQCYPGGPKTDYGPLQGASGQGLKSIRTAGPGHSPVLEYDEQVVAECERLLTDRANDASFGSRPLFLTVGLYGPHHPYVCPQAAYDRARAMMASADVPLPPYDPLPHPWIAAWFERLQADRISAEEPTVARACYAGLVELTDSYVGRVLAAAEALPGDTWIVYVSDHGDMAGDRGMFWKRNMLEGAIRVPMVWYPLRQCSTCVALRPGARVDVPVSLLDLAPTFVSIAGAPALPEQDGSDLTSLLEGSEAAGQNGWQSRPVFVELATPQDGVQRTVISGAMKLIYFDGYPEHLLFDLERDPHEAENVWGFPHYEEVQERLMSFVADGDWTPSRIREHLRAGEAGRRYLTRWGHEVGMGKSDLWKQPLPRPWEESPK